MQLSHHVCLRNCLIADNRATVAYYPGGIYVLKDAVGGGVESCTLAGNNGDYGGMRIRADTYQVVNTVIAGNTGPQADDMVISVPNATNQFFHSCCPTFSLPAANANLQLDPRFADAGAGDYRLGNGLPCLQAGMNQPWMAAATDLEGRRRIDSVVGTVDLGCYEHLLGGALLLVR